MIERFEKMFKELLDMVLVLKQRCDTIKAERDALRREVAALQAIIDLLPAEFLLQVIEHFEYTGFHTTARILQEFADAVAARKGA